MTHIINNPIPKLRKAPQPPLSHPGATPDSDRAKKPRLAEPAATDEELNPGDRVEGLGNFGKPTGQFGTVEQTNEADAVVKWDDYGRVTDEEVLRLLFNPLQPRPSHDQLAQIRTYPAGRNITFYLILAKALPNIFT